MKRSLLIVLVALFGLAFAACGGGQHETAPTKQPIPSTATSSPTAEPGVLGIAVLSPTEGEEVSGVITLQVAVEGTVLMPAAPSGLPSEGSHWHVLIDGQPYPEPFSTSSGSIGTLQPGRHTIRVALYLNQNDMVEVASDEVKVAAASE